MIHALLASGLVHLHTLQFAEAVLLQAYHVVVGREAAQLLLRLVLDILANPKERPMAVVRRDAMKLIVEQLRSRLGK